MSIAKRKTTTSTEVKNRWKAKAYKIYQVQFRKDEDADLIGFIDANKERIGTTELFRRAVERLKTEGLD